MYPSKRPHSTHPRRTYRSGSGSSSGVNSHRSVYHEPSNFDPRDRAFPSPSPSPPLSNAPRDPARPRPYPTSSLSWGRGKSSSFEEPNRNLNKSVHRGNNCINDKIDVSGGRSHGQRDRFRERDAESNYIERDEFESHRYSERHHSRNFVEYAQERTDLDRCGGTFRDDNNYPNRSDHNIKTPTYMRDTDRDREKEKEQAIYSDRGCMENSMETVEPDRNRDAARDRDRELSCRNVHPRETPGAASEQVEIGWSIRKTCKDPGGELYATHSESHAPPDPVDQARANSSPDEITLHHVEPNYNGFLSGSPSLSSSGNLSKNVERALGGPSNRPPAIEISAHHSPNSVSKLLQQVSQGNVTISARMSTKTPQDINNHQRKHLPNCSPKAPKPIPADFPTMLIKKIYLNLSKPIPDLPSTSSLSYFSRMRGHDWQLVNTVGYVVRRKNYLNGLVNESNEEPPKVYPKWPAKFARRYRVAGFLDNDSITPRELAESSDPRGNDPKKYLYNVRKYRAHKSLKKLDKYAQDENDPKDDERVLVLSNLSHNSNKEFLQQELSPYGKIVNIVIYSYLDVTHAGLASIQFDKVKSAVAAVRAFTGRTLMGRKISIQHDPMFRLAKNELEKLTQDALRRMREAEELAATQEKERQELQRRRQLEDEEARIRLHAIAEEEKEKLRKMRELENFKLMELRHQKEKELDNIYKKAKTETPEEKDLPKKERVNEDIYLPAIRLAMLPTTVEESSILHVFRYYGGRRAVRDGPFWYVLFNKKKECLATKNKLANDPELQRVDGNIFKQKPCEYRLTADEYNELWSHSKYDVIETVMDSFRNELWNAILEDAYSRILDKAVAECLKPRVYDRKIDNMREKLRKKIVLPEFPNQDGFLESFMNNDQLEARKAKAAGKEEYTKESKKISKIYEESASQLENEIRIAESNEALEHSKPSASDDYPKADYLSSDAESSIFDTIQRQISEKKTIRAKASRKRKIVALSDEDEEILPEPEQKKGREKGHHSPVSDIDSDIEISSDSSFSLIISESEDGDYFISESDNESDMDYLGTGKKKPPAKRVDAAKEKKQKQRKENKKMDDTILDDTKLEDMKLEDTKMDDKKMEVDTNLANKSVKAPQKKEFIESFNVNKSGCARTEPYKKLDPLKKINFIPNPKIWQDQGGPVDVRENRSHMRKLRQAMEVFNMSEDLTTMFASKKSIIRFGRSKIHGWGLYAGEAVESGELIMEYAGELVRRPLADLREHKYARQGLGDFYLFRLDDSLIVDATRKGAIARYVNHSCEPNLIAKVVTFSNRKRILFYSRTYISVGEELTYDYKLEYEDETQKIVCLCRAQTCRGYLN